ncbi:hypothetical protein PR048_002369 [Dryococelus australis]|uniref:Uncharacterized protein n=1 Tax=Dryococelus australis TaxID=614101 RepID=A0ABQ9IMH0_9NEOP|nr:hypothetical protein PR048_002369 [Dryococelus australis]
MTHIQKRAGLLRKQQIHHIIDAEATLWFEVTGYCALVAESTNSDVDGSAMANFEVCRSDVDDTQFGACRGYLSRHIAAGTTLSGEHGGLVSSRILYPHPPYWNALRQQHTPHMPPTPSTRCQPSRAAPRPRTEHFATITLGGSTMQQASPLTYSHLVRMLSLLHCRHSVGTGGKQVIAMIKSLANISALEIETLTSRCVPIASGNSKFNMSSMLRSVNQLSVKFVLLLGKCKAMAFLSRFCWLPSFLQHNKMIPCAEEALGGSAVGSNVVMVLFGWGLTYELDRRVRARQARPKSIAQLMEWLQEEWRRISVDVLQTLVESMPDRMAAVIATRALNCSPPTKANRVQFPAGSLGYPHVGIVSDDAIGLRVFSGISRFPRPSIPALFYSHLISPSSAFNTSLRHHRNTARLALRSDETLEVGISVARIALSLLDLEEGGGAPHGEGSAGLRVPGRESRRAEPAWYRPPRRGRRGAAWRRLIDTRPQSRCDRAAVRTARWGVLPPARHGLAMGNGMNKSPSLNPIEHLWDELDRRVRARQARPKSIAQLMEWLQEEWRRIPVDVLQTLVERMPDRVAAVIAARGGSTRS